jgi:hypothetical protein
MLTVLSRLFESLPLACTSEDDAPSTTIKFSHYKTISVNAATLRFFCDDPTRLYMDALLSQVHTETFPNTHLRPIDHAREVDIAQVSTD